MKTAISIDGDLLREADRTARRLGLSRSKLFSVDLEGFLYGEVCVDAVRSIELIAPLLTEIIGGRCEVAHRP